VAERLGLVICRGEHVVADLHPAAIVVVPTAEEPRHVLVITELDGRPTPPVR